MPRRARCGRSSARPARLLPAGKAASLGRLPTFGDWGSARRPSFARGLRGDADDGAAMAEVARIWGGEPSATTSPQKSLCSSAALAGSSRPGITISIGVWPGLLRLFPSQVSVDHHVQRLPAKCPISLKQCSQHGVLTPGLGSVPSSPIPIDSARGPAPRWLHAPRAPWPLRGSGDGLIELGASKNRALFVTV